MNHYLEATGDTLRESYLAPAPTDMFDDLLAALDASLVDAAAKATATATAKVNSQA